MDRKYTELNFSKVIDIFDLTKKRFFAYQECVDIFGMTLTHMQYCSLISAIPILWKQKLKYEELSDPLDIKISVVSWLKRKPLGKSASSIIYWQLIEKLFPTPSPPVLNWNAELKIHLSEEEFRTLYPSIMNIIKPTKLRYFQYRILIRSLTTNVRCHS